MNDEIDAATLESIVFIGDVLGPIFYYEPFAKENVDIYAALEQLDAEKASKEWPFANRDKACAALDLISDGLKNKDDDGLLWEYRRLFVGPAAKAAPPWGSVYTDKDQVIFGRSTLELRQWMREIGIAKLSNDGDPEDHLGLMLLMMSWIANNKPGKLKEFLSGHLLTWAPHFLEYVDNATENPFYKGVAQITSASLSGIENGLGLKVDRPRFYR